MTFTITPLEQFSIFPLIPLHLGQLNVAFTNSALFMLLSVTALLLLVTMSTLRSTLIPGRWQAALEMMYEFVFDMVLDNLGETGQRYFPFVFALFVFILFCNLLGLIPYSFTVTSHIIVTFFLALSIWIGVTILGFTHHGIRFFGFFFPEGVTVSMAPFLVFIELISYISRPLSLSIRLFANMMSGHALFKIMAGFSWSMFSFGGAIYLAGFLPLAFLVILTGLELGICCIQAYVFTILTVLYINDAIHLH